MDTVAKEPLIYSHMAATVAWRDEMQGVARSQGLFSLTRDATRQFARQAPSLRVAVKSGARFLVRLGIVVTATTCAVRVALFPIWPATRLMEE